MTTFHGTAQLWRTWISPDPVSSTSRMDLYQDAEGRVTSLEYTWEVDGTAQRGGLSVQSHGTGSEVTVQWKDSWHAGDGMVFQGTYGEVLDVLGSYACPPGPDWGWRIVIRRSPWEVEMENITPEGQAERAFLLSYRTT